MLGRKFTVVTKDRDDSGDEASWVELVVKALEELPYKKRRIINFHGDKTYALTAAASMRSAARRKGLVDKLRISGPTVAKPDIVEIRLKRDLSEAERQVE